MLLNFLLLIVGGALVLIGADKLTDGACGMARKFHINEMIIGLTVVAFGTSLPEFVTSFASAIKGSSDISIGNVMGSNIFNTLVIVGASALLFPISISKGTVNKDLPFTFLASVILCIFAFDSLFNGETSIDTISRTDGLALLGFFSIFMAYTYFLSTNKKEQEEVEDTSLSDIPYWKIFIYFILGLAGLVYGGNLFVDNACNIAREWGVSESIIGLTLVAAGTSLPELATSIVAARKGSSSIAIGNVIGSNIFNIFFVMGMCASTVPVNTEQVSYVDMAIMILSVIMLWGFSYTKRTIERWEGGVLILFYLGYLGYLLSNI